LSYALLNESHTALFPRFFILIEQASDFRALVLLIKVVERSIVQICQS